MTSRGKRTHRRLAPWVVATAVIVVWEALCRGFHVPEFLLPSPLAIGSALVQYRYAIIENATWTLATTAIGFGIAVAVGLLIGLTIGASSLVYEGIYPILVAFNSIPKVALVPVFAIWFG